MFCHQAPLNTNINVDVKKQEKQNLIHAFTVDPIALDAQKRFYPLEQILHVKSPDLFQSVRILQWTTSLRTITVRPWLKLKFIIQVSKF